MLFYEFQFILFFVLFFCFFIITRHRYQNFLILSISYWFYGLWDWRFLSLLIVSTFVDFYVSKFIQAQKGSEAKRKLALIVSLCVNFGILGVFKYYNFFVGSFIDAASAFGFETNVQLINVVLPAGISFYTFQTVSYTIDVYRNKIKAEKNFIDFATYVAFFPQLLAGPIERAGDLLPQIKRRKEISLEGVVLGGRLFLWGVFKKVFIADNLARLVDPVFTSPSQYDSLTLLFATYCFAFQIYCDFSGYTDMARGLAKMLGIELSINFNLPYFSKSIKEFWRRWHITLSSWFRDYVYIPLGGSRKGLAMTTVIVMVTFLLSGLWHGAGWNFIIWGAMHGGMISLETVLENSRMTAFWRTVPSPVRMLVTFHIVCFSWIIFRIDNMALYRDFLANLFSFRFDGLQGVLESKTWIEAIESILNQMNADAFYTFASMAFFIFPLLAVQILQHKHQNHLVDLQWRLPVRMFAYSTLSILLITFGVQSGKQFIYFQF